MRIPYSPALIVSNDACTYCNYDERGEGERGGRERGEGDTDIQTERGRERERSFILLIPIAI